MVTKARRHNAIVINWRDLACKLEDPADVWVGAAAVGEEALGVAVVGGAGVAEGLSGGMTHTSSAGVLSTVSAGGGVLEQPKLRHTDHRETQLHASTATLLNEHDKEETVKFGESAHKSNELSPSNTLERDGYSEKSGTGPWK